MDLTHSLTHSLIHSVITYTLTHVLQAEDSPQVEAISTQVAEVGDSLKHLWCVNMVCRGLPSM